jgi:DNA polymerase-1
MAKHAVWLIFDVSNLAYRALYTTGDLSYEGVGTGVLFGLFRDIQNFCEIHATDRVAFCFDGGSAARRVIDPEYKRNRHRWEEADEAKEARRELRRQLGRMRGDLLLRIGYRNVFFQKGYEADDLIAMLCQNLLEGDEAVIISTDNDLFQLLRKDKVTIWNPATKRAITEESFSRQHGITPVQWVAVKAIAGCPGDNVIGVRGIGEKTVCKYLRGELKETSKAFQSIMSSDRIGVNELLVRLPLRGTEEIELVEDRVDRGKWDEVMVELGIKNLSREQK